MRQGGTPRHHQLHETPPFTQSPHCLPCAALCPHLKSLPCSLIYMCSAPGALEGQPWNRLPQDKQGACLLFWPEAPTKA